MGGRQSVGFTVIMGLERGQRVGHHRVGIILDSEFQIWSSFIPSSTCQMWSIDRTCEMVCFFLSRAVHVRCVRLIGLVRRRIVHVRCGQLIGLVEGGVLSRAVHVRCGQAGRGSGFILVHPCQMWSGWQRVDCIPQSSPCQIWSIDRASRRSSFILGSPCQM